MKELFESISYKEFLRKLVYAPDVKRGYQAQMAKSIGCQAAYLSQVIKNKSELTEDHAVKLAGFLKLSQVATDYFVLLVRLSRASTPELRAYLENHRQRLLQESEEIQSRVKTKKQGMDEETLGHYFSSWIPSTIHMATSSKSYQTIAALAERLHLSANRVRDELKFLEGAGLVKRQGNSWQFANGPLHFSRQSRINVTHQAARRQQVIRSLDENDPQDIHFSSIFTLDEATFREIKADLLDYIERSHKKIHSGGTEEIYSMCLDVFRLV